MNKRKLRYNGKTVRRILGEGLHLDTLLPGMTFEAPEPVARELLNQNALGNIRGEFGPIKKKKSKLPNGRIVEEPDYYAELYTDLTDANNVNPVSATGPPGDKLDAEKARAGIGNAGVENNV